MAPVTRRRFSILPAAALAVVYVGSKVHYALEGRLGIVGGPRVPDAERALYSSVEQTALAQWANVAVGILILIITLLPLTSVARRWSRWILAIPLLLAGFSLIGFAVFMIINGALSGAGGYPFGIFSAVWGALVLAIGVGHFRDRRRRRGE